MANYLGFAVGLVSRPLFPWCTCTPGFSAGLLSGLEFEFEPSRDCKNMYMSSSVSGPSSPWPGIVPFLGNGCDMMVAALLALLLSGGLLLLLVCSRFDAANRGACCLGLCAPPTPNCQQGYLVTLTSPLPSLKPLSLSFPALSSTYPTRRIDSRIRLKAVPAPCAQPAALCTK